MVYPISSTTIPRIQSTSGVNTSRTLTLWERSGFLTILRSCCRGYVSHIIDLAYQIDFHRSQGTKVLEHREIRHRFFVSAEGAPPQKATPRITKYTGTRVSPEWQDVEKGAVLPFTPWFLAKSSQSRQTNSKRYAVSRPTFPMPRM